MSNVGTPRRKWNPLVGHTVNLLLQVLVAVYCVLLPRCKGLALGIFPVKVTIIGTTRRLRHVWLCSPPIDSLTTTPGLTDESSALEICYEPTCHGTGLCKMTYRTLLPSKCN